MTIADDLRAVQTAYSTLGTRLTAAQAAYTTLGTKLATLAKDLAPVVPVPIPPIPPTGSAKTFYLPDFTIQAKSQSRVTIVQTDRGPAMRLHTEPGDTNIDGSGNMRRCDLYLAQPGGAPIVYGEGVEQWWQMGTLLPDDFSYPTWQMYVLMDFHNSDPGPYQANLHLNFDNSPAGSLRFRGFGGQGNMAGPYSGMIGPVQKNVWLDQIYHAKWSSGSGGFMDAWVNGNRILSHQGPTMYAGQGVYTKLACYHVPVYEPFVEGVDNGPPSSVIHAYPTVANSLADLGWALDATGKLVKL